MDFKQIHLVYDQRPYQGKLRFKSLFNHYAFK
jgi:hypothetical protein